jgi:hypothetical protein
MLRSFITFGETTLRTLGLAEDNEPIADFLFVKFLPLEFFENIKSEANTDRVEGAFLLEDPADEKHFVVCFIEFEERFRSENYDKYIRYSTAMVASRYHERIRNFDMYFVVVYGVGQQNEPNTRVSSLQIINVLSSKADEAALFDVLDQKEANNEKASFQEVYFLTQIIRGKLQKNRKANIDALFNKCMAYANKLKLLSRKSFIVFSDHMAHFFLAICHPKHLESGKETYT